MLIKDDLSIVICAQAGQGIESVAEFLMQAFKNNNYNVFSCKEYMSRVRGGCNSAQIRVASSFVGAYSEKIDILIALSKEAIPHLHNRISQDTIILYEENCFSDALNAFKQVEVPFSKTAMEIGGKIYANTVSAGVILGMFGLDLASSQELIQKQFSDKPQKVIQDNINAINKGFELGIQLACDNKIEIKIEQDPDVASKILISGNDAIAIGAIAGGCDFISSYPMTPGTGVFTFLSQKQDDFSIISEQAEDEIASINMALGAWYAGARAMVSTSGGGFALMAEGISLAGMCEIPVVVHLAQRPGPATGLPTRTEQADLEFVIHSSHGEFPKIILAPGTPEDAFELSKTAFEFADKFQIPVFILSDQYFVDTSFISQIFNVADHVVEQHVIETKEDYERYRLTADGISPRGVPSYGKGLVCCDSDEHTEFGNITENLETRVKMVDKRLKKFDMINQEVIEPELFGSKHYKTLVVGWGSTCGVLKEVIERLKSPDIAFLHFKQVFPVHPIIEDYMQQAQCSAIVENNATGQFANLIKLKTGLDFDFKLLKYNGMPFSIEELLARVSELGGSL